MNYFKQKTFPISLILVCIFTILSGCTDKVVDAIFFEDVTTGSGLELYKGMTHGVFWGDVDGDGLPDVYLTNHLNKAQLFRNTGKGNFVDVTLQYLSTQKNGMGDKHGAAWADFNNDGLQDLVQLTGAGRGIGAEPKFLLENQGGKLVNVAQELGVENSFGRTRMPLWFDFDQNGLLDLFHGAEKRFDERSPPMLYAQHKGKFIVSDTLKFISKTTPFCILTSLSLEISVDVLCRMTGEGRTSQIFSIKGRDIIEKKLLPATGFNDIAAADFDNNGLIDLVLARKNGPGSIAFGWLSDNEIIADIWIDSKNVKKEMGFTFHSTGEMTAKILSTFPKGALTLKQLYLGESGQHPKDFIFPLSSQNFKLKGIKLGIAGSQAGVHVGMTEKNQWKINVTASNERINQGKYQQITIKIKSSKKITELESIGEELKDEKAPVRLFMNYGDKLKKEGDSRGVHAEIIAGTNVVAADIDNDMDVDIFMIASGDIGSQENMLFLNRGDGNFDPVALSGGAKSNKTGVADSVTTADFDNDGFLDLLISTGGSMGRSLGLPSDEGSYHLYRNIGNENHWLKINLEGVESNRDGIGAVVKLTAGGVTQTRVQDGGMHNKSQNYKQLHFGLGGNVKIEKIIIHWPNGQRQELNGVLSDQTLRIKEPS